MPLRDTIELLAPAGGPEQLQAALHFGANAVYLAGQRWGMRARADNFSNDELASAVSLAHKHGAQVHLTLNTLMYDCDIADLPEYLHFIDDVGVDAVIVADLGAIALVRSHAPHVAIHVSTQASVTNAPAALEYARLGASRIVLAREMTIEQIAALHAQVGDALELEAFVHGALCMAVSGRCLLSAIMVGPERSAGKGACTQPCRWTWTINEESRPNQNFGLEMDEHGSYLLSANDLCMIEHLDELADAGIASIKIEGRNKGAYYVAAVTNAYRQVLDGADAQVWMRELAATSHRPYSSGFYFGNPTQNPGHTEYSQDRTLIAVVEGSTAHDDIYHTEIICRNRANVGDELVVLAPHSEVRSLRAQSIELWDEVLGMWQPTSALRMNMHRYRITTPYPLAAGDLLCKANEP